LTFVKLLDGIKKANSSDELNRVAAFAALKALAAIAFSWVTLAFYGSLVAFGPITSQAPFSILNFGIFFLSGLFFD